MALVLLLALGRCCCIPKRILQTPQSILLYLTLINRFLGWTGTNGIIRYGYISVLYTFFFFEHKINYMVDRDPTLFNVFVVYARTKQASGRKRQRQ